MRDGDGAQSGHIPGLSPPAPLAHCPHTGPLIAHLPLSSVAAGTPCVPSLGSLCALALSRLGSSMGVHIAYACPQVLCPHADHTCACLPQLPAAAMTCQPAPSSLQMMAGTVVQHAVMPNPGLPAVGVQVGAM